jgi:CheY-like chemotaxis protein/DNA-binding Xre family transcriptional regulator
MPGLADKSLRELLTKFGSIVRTQRRQAGFSQEELADRSGLHRTYVTDVERGVRNVSLDSISRLARALDLQLTDLFALVEGKSPPAHIPGTALHAAGPATRSVDILLVEDNPRHAELTIHALEKNGVTNNIHIAKSGAEALDLLFDGRETKSGTLRPRVILLDLSLPDIDGLEVLRQIRSDPQTRSIPVVVLTASRSDQDYSESLKLGVTAYITKPVDFIEFSTVMPKLGFRWLLTEQA